MKRFAAIIALLVMMGLCGTAAAQALLPLPRAANPPMQIASAINNHLIHAYSIYPDVALVVQGVEVATVEVGEVLHSCAASGPTTGAHSIWFAAYLPAGKLTVKTNGTAYVTSGGVKDDTVVSVWRVTGDQNTINFTTLAAVGCASGGTGAASLKNLAVTQCTYLIQVSMESGTALTGSAVAVRATFKAARPISGDDRAAARPLTFPANLVITSIGFATAELDEPPAAMLPPGTLISRSIWYTFELKAAMRVMIGVSGVGSLYRVQTDGALIPVPFSGAVTQGDGLTEGKYLLRVAVPAAQLPIGALDDQLFASQLTVTPVLSPVNAGLGTGEGTGSAAASLAEWTVKRATPTTEPHADVPVCGFAPNQCGFQFTSMGVSEKTQLMGTMRLNNIRLKRFELMLLAVSGTYTGNGHVRLKATLWDASGAHVTITRVMYPTANGLALAGFEALPRSFAPVRAKITITHLSQNAGDKAIVDDVALVAYRLGDPARGK